MSSKIETLTKKDWKDFNLSGEKGIFQNYHGKRLIKNNRIKGKTPLLTAGEQNNGVSDFDGFCPIVLQVGC